MSDERLRECPFCGGEGNVSLNTCYGFVPWCSNEDCILNENTKGFSTKEEAVNAWNNRQPMERIVEKLEEQFNYNAEQAEIWRSGENVDAYMIEKSNDYLDRANCYGKAIRRVKGGGVDEVG